MSNDARQRDHEAPRREPLWDDDEELDRTNRGRRPHSLLGIISFARAIASVLSVLSFVVVGVSNRRPFQDATDPRVLILGLLAGGFLLSTLVGVALGLLALGAVRRENVFGIVGLCLHVLVALGVGAWLTWRVVRG